MLTLIFFLELDSLVLPFEAEEKGEAMLLVFRIELGTKMAAPVPPLPLKFKEALLCDLSADSMV